MISSEESMSLRLHVLVWKHAETSSDWTDTTLRGTHRCMSLCIHGCVFR